MKILALIGFALSGAEAFTFRSVPRVAPHITGRVASQRFSSASYWPPAGATTGKGKQASSANADKKAVFEPLGRGIAEDVKRRLPLYASDFRDGLSVKSCAAMLFLAFASITPTIGFGSLLSTVTGGQMGVVEFLLAASLCGGSFALLAGQPMALLGPTGPGVAFTVALYGVSAQLGVAFLPFYGWVGLWTALLLALGALTSASNVLKFFTRFTDETFSALVSVIYIVEACKDLRAPFAATATAATGAAASATLCANALLPTAVAALTFVTANILSGFRSSALLSKTARAAVADFAPTLGVAAGALAAAAANGKWAVGTPALAVPSVFGTTSGRAWLVDLALTPVWARWAAFLPALMASLLLFMDQVITVHLVNSPDYKMLKGEGYHLDLLVVAAQVSLCSLAGLPWCVAATVISAGHVNAMAKYDDRTSALVGVDENRVSALGTFMLLGGALAFAPQLALVPKACFTGLFMFLGVTSLTKTQFFERVKLLLSEKGSAPATFRDASPQALRTFTFVQAASLASLYFVKSSRAGVLFPVLIGALVPVRGLMERWGIVSKKDLQVLDN